MGQAKKRGSFEERRNKAIEKKKHIEEIRIKNIEDAREAYRKNKYAQELHKEEDYDREIEKEKVKLEMVGGRKSLRIGLLLTHVLLAGPKF